MDRELFTIKEKFRHKKPRAIDVRNAYSVLIPLIKRDNEVHILFEKRALSLKNQPGEISFPGGGIERGENSRDAAIRETCEELLINKRDLSIIGKGDFWVNPYSAIIYSYVGILNIEFDAISPSKEEVESIFTIPLDFFKINKPNSYKTKINLIREDSFPYELIPNGRNYKWKRAEGEMDFYVYKDIVIWGFTAKMLRNFIKNVY
ncbi:MULTISPECIES: CoA pyrophosphatase [Peptoniphilus]|uniref:NUDIX hydrolase n=1 Tax=Peptoniphilus TaxID=162289 RepID=UPI0001DCA6E1|nr:CoA pyrophosphatase [Peptoniphilus sp. oral taxon 836]EFK39104.1 hydrolase, NUDIX family [Peptoniphilus sp. oral taxon 836 str. F0141]